MFWRVHVCTYQCVLVCVAWGVSLGEFEKGREAMERGCFIKLQHILYGVTYAVLHKTVAYAISHKAVTYAIRL